MGHLVAKVPVVSTHSRCPTLTQQQPQEQDLETGSPSHSVFSTGLGKGGRLQREEGRRVLALSSNPPEALLSSLSPWLVPDYLHGPGFVS